MFICRISEFERIVALRQRSKTFLKVPDWIAATEIARSLPFFSLLARNPQGSGLDVAEIRRVYLIVFLRNAH